MSVSLFSEMPFKFGSTHVLTLFHSTLGKPICGPHRAEQNRLKLKFEYRELQEVAIEHMKAALISQSIQPVLKLYDPKLPTETHTNAVLLQMVRKGSHLHPVMCEEKYHSYELKVVAVIAALTALSWE